MSLFNIPSLVRFANFMGFMAIAGILTLAFVVQIAWNEPPCPLCLLQRVGFLLIMTGFLMNLMMGSQAKHYAVIILGAMYTGVVAMRQISLHIVPGTGSFGEAVFGLHLYTWSFIASVMVIFATAILMIPQRQYAFIKQQTSVLNHIASTIMLLLVIANFTSLVLECGYTECPDNPTSYLLLG